MIPHPGPESHIGGALFRTIEVIRRGSEHGIEYVIVENSPSFNRHFSLSCEGHVTDVRNIVSSPFSFAKTVMDFALAGASRAKKGDIDLIVSPLESPISIMAAYAASRMSKVPWTTVLHSVPGYWYISGSKKGKTSRLLDIYRHQKQHRFYGNSVVFGALTRWLSYKFLRKTRSLTVSRSLDENFRHVEPRMDVTDIFPGNGIDWKRIRNVPKGRKKYDAVFAGAIIPEKGVLDVLDVWSIAGKGKLCIVGRGSRENVRNLEQRIRDLGLQDRVVMPYDLTKGAPRSEDVWREVKSSSIMIYPSLVDAWPLIVGEALACGVPVIAYNIPPIRYSYGKCRAVVTVPKKSTRKMAEAASRLLKNKKRIRSMSKSALKYAKKHDWSSTIRSEKKAYERLLKYS